MEYNTSARITLFGFEDTPADVSLRPRSPGWRAGRAARILGAAVLVAPVVALVPPHVPWALGALGGGVILARRRWAERYTILALTGSCPRCGGELSVRGVVRLRRPHPLGCEACGHEPVLHVDLGEWEDEAGRSPDEGA